MHGHLSKRAEKVVKLASRLAREYGQDFVGTEQILLAIVREGTGRAAAILGARGLDEEKVRAEVDRLIQRSLADSWVMGRLPGTPHFRNVIARAVEEAEKAGAKEVCTEHLLLALLRERGSVARTALAALGIKLGDVRREVRALARRTGTS